MLRILLLDCTEFLKSKLEKQGFSVELGTAGLCTGVRRLPSQVYEKDVFFYDPDVLPADAVVRSGKILNLSPEYDLAYLKDRIHTGATLVAFINRISDRIDVEREIYYWIPYMPEIEFTRDTVVHGNAFSTYPDSEAGHLAPIVTPASLSVPVEQKLIAPKPQDYPRDVFPLFWNARGDLLGVQILRGRGSLIFLPKFKSNADAIETFLHRVVPKLYPQRGKRGLTDVFTSPAEEAAAAELRNYESVEAQLKTRQDEARVRLATATREKARTIEADDTARQILIYHDLARRNDDAALYYLYKIVEAIENKFGGESEGIKAVGAGTEWKAVKRLANESYRDARHAPKPGDVIKKWTDVEIKGCFANVEVVVSAYFSTLFRPTPDKTTKS